jgi:hypothetical protein
VNVQIIRPTPRFAPEDTMRAVALATGVAALCCALVTGCGGGSGGADTSAPASPATPAAPVGGKAGFTAGFVCDSVKADTVTQVLPETGEPRPAEVKDGIHACSWNAPDGSHAVVAVLFDDSFDKNFAKDGLAVANGAAGTGYETATNITIDVGARNVTVYGLGGAGDTVSTSKLSLVANQLNDAIVDADAAARKG